MARQDSLHALKRLRKKSILRTFSSDYEKTAQIRLLSNKSF